MMTYDECKEILENFMDTLPPALFDGLNGGVLLLEELIEDEHELLILGQYHIDDNGLGRYVTIHYGSMVEAFFDVPKEEFARELVDVLKHELLHHVESLAGDRSLEIQDEIDLERFLDEMK